MRKCLKCGYELPKPPKGFGPPEKKAYPIPIKEIVYCPKCGAIVEVISRGKVKEHE